MDIERPVYAYAVMHDGVMVDTIEAYGGKDAQHRLFSKYGADTQHRLYVEVRRHDEAKEAYINNPDEYFAPRENS